MSPKHGILTLAISIALAGCASDNAGWRDTSGTDTNHYNNNNTYATNTGSGLPDNPQVAAVNDKNRAFSHASEADMAFIRDAQAGGTYEVAAGQKALLKASDQSVKNIAQHMVDDHTKANLQLNNLASRKGLPDTSSMTASQIDMLSQLDRSNGADFDRLYLSQQVSAHQDTIAKFESASANANDKDIRDFASATLPTLRDHLNMLQGRTTNMNMNDNTGTNLNNTGSNLNNTGSNLNNPNNSGSNINNTGNNGMNSNPGTGSNTGR
jgi:putative membrane protein